MIESQSEASQLDLKERRKRQREVIAIVMLAVLFVVLTVAEFRLTRASITLPFVNSIFFFGLLNVNLILLIAMVWLVARNIGKLFIERRRRVLGSRLKTKLVIAFLAFSIIPTLVLFVISAMYINSSFDKWFSLKVQNTLQASLEITRTYYRNTDQTAMHFAEHLATGIGKRMAAEGQGASVLSTPSSQWIGNYLSTQRELLALDAVEFYPDPLEERFIEVRALRRDEVRSSPRGEREEPGDASEPDASANTASGEGTSVQNIPPRYYPRLPLDKLNEAFAGQRVSVMQHIGAGDLIRCLFPVRIRNGGTSSVIGVLVVNAYIPVSLVNKVDEIASVFDDYKDTNPLKYPMKTTYLVILILITLVIIIVAIWVGLYMARELTVPVERLVHGAQAVGAGNLDVSVAASGHDEITVLVESFNKMTRDLRDNQVRLIEASADLEKRRLQLEAVLRNIGAGVIAIDSQGLITTFNPSAERLLGITSEQAVSSPYEKVLQGGATPLIDVIGRAYSVLSTPSPHPIDATQWNYRSDEAVRVLSAAVTPLRESENRWGVVVVIDEITHLIKGQRETAWREVARRIAHEIKNPLTPIKLSAQRLQRRLVDLGGKDGALLQECTDTIIKHTDELKEMVNEFSNFARFPEISPAPHNLNEALNEVVKLFHQAHGDISFQFKPEAKLPVFEFDRDQIKRVIINLMDNAVAALKAAGAPTPAVKLATHYNEQLQMAVIEVEDNGPGMSEEVRERAFEPYFSTKTEGTGLGLAIAKRIVNDHDGFIRVHSTPDSGTRFLIELPAK